AMLAGFIALHESDFGAVRTPFDRLRSASCDSGLGEDLFNRELLRRGGQRNVLGVPRGKQTEQVDGEGEEKLFHERTPIQHRAVTQLRAGGESQKCTTWREVASGRTRLVWAGP